MGAAAAFSVKRFFSYNGVIKATIITLDEAVEGTVSHN
jgi:hypothetical protein